LGATAWKPASASARSWWRHEYQLSGKPCSNKTSGPVPASATRIGVPLTWTTLCPMSMPDVDVDVGARASRVV
jgi:hypothetical protein